MAQTIKGLARGTHRGLWRLWSWALLGALGLLTTLLSCRQQDIPVPVYGAPVVLYGMSYVGATP